MTPKQSDYLRQLRMSFNLSQSDAMDLLRAHGIKGPPSKWSEARIEEAATILLDCGRVYQETVNQFARAEAEFKALQAKRPKKAA